MIVIGVDCGLDTGVSVWCQNQKKITFFKRMMIHEALFYLHLRIDEIALVRVEDSRKRKWFGDNSKNKQQGAGSVKRDCKIWEDFLRDLGIPYQMVAPAKGSTYKATKAKPKRMHDFHRLFPKIPRLTTVSEDHIRDATYLCYGINKNYTKSFQNEPKERKPTTKD